MNAAGSHTDLGAVSSPVTAGGGEGSGDSTRAMRSPAETVTEFFRLVRSGAEVNRAGEFMTATVLAHQVRSDSRETIPRTPEDYAEHVRDMLATFGPFRLTIDELIADESKVYVRWAQDGWHRGPIGDFPPTGQPVRAVASAVYRVESGRIAEYWIQQDEAGLVTQLERDAGAGVSE
jgi:predicted ester cyclase